MPKETITQSEYYQLIGLLTLAENHNARLKELEKAVADLLGVANDDNLSSYYGHASDAVYGERDADGLLDVLKIKVWDSANA